MVRRVLVMGMVALGFAVVLQAAPDGSEKTVALFDGQASDLSQWTFELDDPDAKMEDVWSVKEGVLVCKGQPRGYLRTKQDFSDYVLTLEWRWPTSSDPKRRNSGALVHTSNPKELGIWPKSIEVQLGSTNAGDFWVIGTEIQVPNVDERRKGRRHLNLTDDSEKPIGEWNQMEITCRGDEILVKVNGDVVNHATDCSVTKGAVCLQSEGTEVHFRNVKLTPTKSH